MIDEILIRDLSKIIPVPTSHHAGLKQVLLANEETATNITQIAKTKMLAGEVAAAHVHLDMEEYFHFLSGSGTIVIDGVSHKITDECFFRIPCGHSHEVNAITDLSFITIGVKS